MWLGLVVAAAAISAETLLVVVLRSLAPMDTFGVVYLLGALVVAIGWGTGLAAVTSVVSALGFGYFREWPNDAFDPTDLRNWVVIGVFLAHHVDGEHAGRGRPGQGGEGRRRSGGRPIDRRRCGASRPWSRRVFRRLTCSQP